MSKDSELSVVLVGSVGAGKTSVIEAILRSSEPEEKLSQIHMKKCRSYRVKLEGHCTVFFDTPDLCNTEMADKEVMKEIKTCISERGRHVFLFVLAMGRFTEEKKRMVETVKRTLGEEVTDHMILLFTRGNIPQEEKKRIQQFVAESKDLQALDDECGGRRVVFDTEDEDPSQVAELLQQISTLDDGDRYTYNMLRKAESRAGLKTRVALSVNGGALAGAGVGATASHLLQGVLGVGVGAVVGAVAGGLVGFVGVVAAQHIQERCLLK